MVSDNSHSDCQPFSRNQTKIQQVQVQNLPDLPQITRPDQDKYMHNHEQTCCEMDVTERKQEYWVIEIKNRLDKAQRDNDRARWGELCIYKVPHYLNENDKTSYFPKTVSLGPYHHLDVPLQSMQAHKWRAVDRALKRWKRPIEMYIDAMKEIEGKARACYEFINPPDPNVKDDFIKMLILDGCFVLEVLLGTYEGFTEIGYAPNDPVFAMRGLMHSIRCDMLMLENQLPMFVLNELLAIHLGKKNNKPGMVAFLTVQFFNPLMPTEEASTKPRSLKLINWFGESVDSPDQVDFSLHKGALHCLDVFRRSFFQSSPTSTSSGKIASRMIWTSKTDKRQQQLIHCVTELREAGIGFRRRKADRFWDIQFKNGYLEIPKLLIHEGTKALFSNLIAFEQCHSNSTNHMTTYIIFMDNLINSSSDVGYLHSYGIIEHWLGSDSEVADLFNRLCREVVFQRQDSYLSPLSDEVNKYYSRQWNTWKATLKHNYFSNPWAYFSFFAAVILLILTTIQSFYAVYAYYKPNS